MLERPALDDSTLLAGLRQRYGLAIESLAFDPLGNDSAAWTYRAAAADGGIWFVKVRRDPRPAGILVPRFLHDHGLPEVVAARPTQVGEPWLEIGPWSVLVYPFVEAPRAMDAGMDEGGWTHLGAFAARLHATVLPRDLAAIVPREDFRPKTTEMARRVARHVDVGADSDPERTPHPDEIGERLVAAWLTHRELIDRLVRRSEELARRIRVGAGVARPLRFVPCHADLHAGNVLVGADGTLSIVDWDEVVLAPPERDLMFVRGSVVAGLVTDREATAFESGYGTGEASEPDPLLIAWYRIDWAVQDLADFARRVLLDPELGDATRARALALFESVFEPGGEVDTALAADALVPASPTQTV
jgi:spectinomycin phosphotransferase